MADYFYFAQDGSYGLWETGSVLTPTDYWTALDWENVENATNSERTKVVREICDRRIKDMKGII